MMNQFNTNFMKVRFESGDDLPLGKTFNISDMIIVAASVLEKNAKYYPQKNIHETFMEVRTDENKFLLISRR